MDSLNIFRLYTRRPDSRRDAAMHGLKLQAEDRLTWPEIAVVLYALFLVMLLGVVW